MSGLLESGVLPQKITWSELNGMNLKVPLNKYRLLTNRRFFKQLLWVGHKLAPAMLVILSLSMGGVWAAESIAILDLRINEAPPGASATAGYLSLENRGETDIELVEVTGTDFGKIEIHRTRIEDGVARMLRQAKVTIPATGGVEFKPGDYHLMIFRPARTFQAGEETVLEFHFSDGSTIPATASITPIRPQSAKDSGDHGGH
ncbi:MAG: hypothetical protein A3I78_04285 [Gammaproteobacteria bacterium RIFCSPLOWO2_02_FULL_56_15]|nr:MAG: hypothetical protein A3I78_04285 [Gammaproteobacteria bacterium RIFCSPLOWO2_02_FULL_56_15]